MLGCPYAPDFRLQVNRYPKIRAAGGHLLESRIASLCMVYGTAEHAVTPFLFFRHCRSDFIIAVRAALRPGHPERQSFT